MRAILSASFGVALAILAGHPAAADRYPGANLSWDDCGSFGAENLSNACGGGPHALIVSVKTGEEPIFGVVGFELKMSYHAEWDSLPEFWRLESSDCRDSALYLDLNFLEDPGSCSDFWDGRARGGIHLREVRGSVGEIRAIAATHAAGDTLEADREYGVFRILIGEGTGSCAGCDVAACITINRLEIARVAGYPGGGIVLDSAPSDGRLSVTWERPDANCLYPVPVQSRTWGSVKAMYR